MNSLHAGRVCWIILGVALALAVAAACLPDNPYQRWQQLHGTIYDETRWIYERCHFDPAPVDIAILGSSRTRQGINAPRLEADLAARGLHYNVVNFSLLSAGRGSDYAITQELFEEKHPRLIIIGVPEFPVRSGQPAYKYIARRETIVAPHFARYFGYFTDLIYLPYRQLNLFLMNIFSTDPMIIRTFQSSLYAGTNIDTTGTVNLTEKRRPGDEDPGRPEDLSRQAEIFRRKGEYRQSLPKILRELRRGDERTYLRRITNIARSRGAAVVFLYVPYYTGPDQPYDPEIYHGLGPLWNAGFLSSHAEWWADFVHVTREGANHLTDWLAVPVAKELDPAGDGAAPGAGSPPTKSTGSLVSHHPVALAGSMFNR